MAKRAKKIQAGKPAARTSGRVKKSIGMPHDLARRLAAYAAWHGKDEQAVVCEALEPVLAGFYVATRGPAAAADPPAAEALRVVDRDPGESVAGDVGGQAG